MYPKKLSILHQNEPHERCSLDVMMEVVITYQFLNVVACENQFRQTWQSVFKVFTKATRMKDSNNAHHHAECMHTYIHGSLQLNSTAYTIIVGYS